MEIKFILSMNCFSYTIHTVLGFGENFVTVVLLAVLGVTQRNGRRSCRVGLYYLAYAFFDYIICILEIYIHKHIQYTCDGYSLMTSEITQMNRSDKFFLYLVPAIELSLTFLDIVFLLKKALEGEVIALDEWLFRCSYFAVWVSFEDTKVDFFIVRMCVVIA